MVEATIKSNVSPTTAYNAPCWFFNRALFNAHHIALDEGDIQLLKAYVSVVLFR